MTFEVKAIRYAPEQFVAHVNTLTWKKGWRPNAICLHNTYIPDIAQGLSSPEADREANYKAGYLRMGWHSGPHLNVWPTDVWELCDLEQDGVHASCFNRGPPHGTYGAIGIEMLGNFAHGADDFHSGPGAQIRDLSVLVMAALYRKLMLDPERMLFHRDCLADHHPCPGDQVDKQDMIARVKAKMVELAAGDRAAVTTTKAA